MGLDDLRFYTFIPTTTDPRKKIDLKKDEETRFGKGCSDITIKSADLNDYTEGETIAEFSCDIPAEGHLPAVKGEKFRVSRQGDRVAIEGGPDFATLTTVNPETQPLVLLRRDLANPTDPYSSGVVAFENREAFYRMWDLRKSEARKSTKDTFVATGGPAFEVTIGLNLPRGGEIDLPSVPFAMYDDTTLDRTSAEPFGVDAGWRLGFEPRWSRAKLWGKILDTAFRFSINGGKTTLSAGDTVSGIPDVDATVRLSQMHYLEWSLGFSSGTWFPDFPVDIELLWQTPLIGQEWFFAKPLNEGGTYPSDGASLAKGLDESHWLHFGNDAEEFSHAIALGGRYCWKNGVWFDGSILTPCLGLRGSLQFARTARMGDFAFDFDNHWQIDALASVLSYGETQSVTSIDPYDIVIDNIPGPTIVAPTPPPPPPNMVGIQPPQRLSLEIKGAEAKFTIGSAKLLPGTKKTIEDKMVNPIGAFWRKLLAQGYSPNQPLYLNIGGHASPDGPEDMNLRLSERRGGSVEGYLKTRFQQENNAAWRIAKKDNPKLNRKNWAPPYPDPANIVFQTQGYGESEPILLSSGQPDLENSRRFVASVFTDAKEAAAAMKVGKVAAEVAALDPARANATVAALAKSGLNVRFHEGSKTILVTAPVSWNGIVLDGAGKVAITKIGNAVRRAAPLFKKMSREVKLLIGTVSTPATTPALELERADVVKEALFGLKQFRSWPAKGPSTVVPIPTDLPDPLAHLETEAAKPTGPVVLDVQKVLKALGGKIKSIAIDDKKVKLYSFPVKLDPAGKPTPEMLETAAAIGQTLQPTEWLVAAIYRHPDDNFDAEKLMQQLYARGTDAHREKHGKEVDPSHFALTRPETNLPNKATRIYVVISEQQVPQKKITDKIFELSVGSRPTPAPTPPTPTPTPAP